jgi:protein-serine/threonine kinase
MAGNVHHEESTVLERLVISDPIEDEARVQARVEEARPHPPGSNMTPVTDLSAGTAEAADNSTRQPSKSRHESGRRKDVKFGDYILGQTLGEGEFGKVKMGWKRDGSAQVAIKLIRKEVLGSNPSRLPKIYREIKILEGLNHPNIVQLHEKVETERHIGIILEYASGGELFDYILQHRYLKDNAARRLFAQLISGVGYLHKKGIVHRDLKLENLLLDRNRNIIITDFGFANTFDPKDELGTDMEEYLHDKDFVKRMGLDVLDTQGHRRGDLMQTSCGSPCYAAPELVVSDSLYTGRKVDVWSCGVILVRLMVSYLPNTNCFQYAMLAGYLPFDDDPANPEGDNINLLYKYIVSTPLIFPEYVTPHARDLLKRILVPNPRQRADLFEIARHSWLSEYSHVVGLITSSTTTPVDIANTTVPSGKFSSTCSRIYSNSLDRTYDAPSLARSASVREPTTKSHPARSTVVVGGLSQKPGHVDQAEADKKARDTKRRTVQVEYVAPQSPTTREQIKVLPRADEELEPDLSVDSFNRTAPITSMAPPSRPVRDQQRSISENIIQNSTPYYSSQRPSTGGSLSAATRVPSSTYGQPAVGIAKEQAQGRFSQPRLASYNDAEEGQPGDRRSYMLPDDSKGFPQTVASVPGGKRSQGHKRSSTLSGLGEKLGFVKRSSLFGGSRSNNTTDNDDSQAEKPAKKSKRYPPVSMSKPMPNDNSAATSGGDISRKSTESSRRTSFSFGRKSSRNNAADSTSADQDQQPTSKRTSRRFSLLPSFTRSSHASKDELSSKKRTSIIDNRPRMAFGRGESRSSSRSTTEINLPQSAGAGMYDAPAPYDNRPLAVHRKPVPQHAQHAPPTSAPRDTGPPRSALSMESSGGDNPSDDDDQHNMPVMHPGFGGGPGNPYSGFSSSQHDVSRMDVPSRPTSAATKPGVLHKRRDNRFNDAYEQQESGHAGSSGAARRVMAMFNFRRRAKG